MKKKLSTGLATGVLIFSMAGMVQATSITANESSSTSGSDDTTATAQNVGTLTSGDDFIIDGAIDSNNGDDVDFYKFTITNPMSLFFDIDYANDIGNPNDDDTGVDTQLAIFDENNMLLSYNDDSWVFDYYTNDPGSLPNGDFDSLIGALELTAGSYYIAVSSYAEDDDYNIYNVPKALYNGWFTDLSPLSISGILIDGAYGGSDFELSGGRGIYNSTGSYQLVISESFDGDVPEPASMLLYGVGLAGLVGTTIRRKKKSIAS